MILTAVISVSATYAALLITHDVTTTLIVRPTVSMEVLDTDGATLLTEINLTQFAWQTTKYFPGGSELPPTDTFYFINNTDHVSFYVSFAIKDYPDGSTFAVSIKRGDKETFTTLSGEQIYKFPIESYLMNPNPATQYAVWYFSFSVWTPEFGTYNPTITINAYDNATG